ncbi:MAG: holin [Fluviibacter sp.]
MFSVPFFQDALWRAFRTFCQTLLSIFGGSALNVWNVGWHNSFGVAAGAALISLLMSVDRSTAAPVIVETPVEPAPAAVPATFVTQLQSKPTFNPPVTVACGDSLK